MDNREQLKEKILSVKDANKDIKIVYEVLDELGIKYKRTKCQRCRNDLRNIALEELGLIDDAAEMSDFNGEYEYEYLLARPQSWNGHLMDQDTPAEVIEKFLKQFPNGYYRKVVRTENEETINNQE